MGKTIRGNKSPGYEYWSARPGNYSGGKPGEETKKITHKAERRKNKYTLDKLLKEAYD